MYIHIYIYIERERERYISLYIYIYIYSCFYLALWAARSGEDHLADEIGAPKPNLNDIGYPCPEKFYKLHTDNTVPIRYSNMFYKLALGMGTGMNGPAQTWKTLRGGG